MNTAPTPIALIGPGSLLESDDRPTWWSLPGRPHRLEAAIGADNGDGTLTIHHWFAGQQRPDNPWLRGDVISAAAHGPAVLGQRGRPGTSDHHLVAHVPESDGVAVYTWAVNEPSPRQWQRVGTVDAMPTPDRPAWDGPEGAAEWGDQSVVAAATAATRLKNSWVQALAQVGGSLYHLHRQVRRGRVRWFRHACLRLEDRSPSAVAPQSSRKRVQISGETDTQPAATDGPRRTLSRSESTAGVRGTDLGVRIDHEGRTFLLFGDTHWAGRGWLGTRDSIAEVHHPDDERPEVRFHGAPLNVRGKGVTMREYDVPLDAFSLGGQLYAFVTSNHFRDAQVMGRSVLTRVRQPVRIDPGQRWRGVRLQPLDTLSDDRFINVSVQREGDLLYLWGTGAYRADDVRLARVDLSTPGVADGLRRGDAAPFLAALEYWAGEVQPVAPAETSPNATPRWSPDEADARPLFTPGALGELSVRWVPDLGRYLMLTMAGPDDPLGAAVVLRTAVHPWGPWSPRVKLFDWVASGMCFDNPAERFIKASAGGDDPVGDAMFRGQANATGAAYAPYLFDARVEGDRLRLRYTLSTWNPYQVVLMEHDLELVGL